MNRTEYQTAVYESDLDAVSKAVIGCYVHHKNFKNDGRVWISAETIATETGHSLRSVKDRIPRLRDAGWLIDTGERKPNGKGRPSVVYDLSVGVALKVEDKGAAVAPKVEHFSADTTGLKCKDEGTLVQNQHDFSAPVAHEQEREQETKQEKEQERESDTVATAPVPDDFDWDSPVKRESKTWKTTPNLKVIGGGSPNLYTTDAELRERRRKALGKEESA